MPWEQTWVPNPADDSIPVHETLPEGFEVVNEIYNYKVGRVPLEKVIEASEKKLPVDTRIFYHCNYCKGWIHGHPYEYHQDDIGPLCGRRGYVSSCIRCGNEIAFCGMVS
jgi:hypothetical protein